MRAGPGLGNSTGNFMAAKRGPAFLSSSEPLRNFASSTLAPGDKSTKNSPLAVLLVMVGTLTVRMRLNSSSGQIGVDAAVLLGRRTKFGVVASMRYFPVSFL